MLINSNQNNLDNRIDLQLKIFESINNKIEHEDNLFVSRITWFISLQSLLFFPVFLIFSQTIGNYKGLTKLSQTFFRHQEDLFLGIILTGLGFCFIVLLGCQAGHFRVNQLTELYRQKTSQFRQEHPDYFHLILEIKSPPLIRLLCFIASFGSIFIFSKIWLFLEIIADINKIAMFASFIIAAIIDSIIMHNLFDCVLKFLIENKLQKILCHIKLSIAVVFINLFMYSCINIDDIFLLWLLFFIVVIAIFVLFKVKLTFFYHSRPRKNRNYSMSHSVIKDNRNDL